MSVDIGDIKEVVEEAGQLAMLYYGKVSRSLKADLSIVTEADAAIEEFLKVSLASLAPDYGYIGEETEETKGPAAGETRSWVVDALDGSRAFAVRIPIWTPAVCLLDGARPVAGAAINPVTGELFWADEDGGAYCNNEPLRPDYPKALEPNSIIIGPTNYHRLFDVDFPGRIYCMGAPIYQLCLVAKGVASAMFFDANVNLWDLALPSILLERAGGTLIYASGRAVDIAELMDCSKIKEPIFAGGKEMVEIIRQGISFNGFPSRRS
ncbi:MAG: inositol monophosphatase [Rhodospirillales bacterium]|jgi:myo-inositol-1(or 4)-monophosphatase|nr:inositol monophosphatase [Rhodospirillales bacterium]MDP6642764.1 inositol monophosphatase [Rhodospirillales bacterium]MDP6841504.1 inositol monophosphatase [Rhodospirillales bacterium]|tara:strand:- start:93 stop:890 length:798 start_codon:yes stop_codon:yes gene_type:complete